MILICDNLRFWILAWEPENCLGAKHALSKDKGHKGKAILIAVGDIFPGSLIASCGEDSSFE
jgi:hypothetical protein